MPHIVVVSFGYKHRQPPAEAVVVINVLGLNNPHHRPNLRNQDGRCDTIKQYVRATPFYYDRMDRAEKLARTAVKYHCEEPELWVAVGCNAGRHRSVVFAEDLAARLADLGEVTVIHSELKGAQP